MMVKLTQSSEMMDENEVTEQIIGVAVNQGQ